MEERSVLDKLRSGHHPQRVVSRLHELFTHELKWIWHDTYDDKYFKWTDPSGKICSTYADYLKYARTILELCPKNYLPEDILNALKCFVGAPSNDESCKSLDSGWNNEAWQAWLADPATASLDPNISANKFPGYDDILTFRDKFRCQSKGALKRRLESLCESYWTNHKDIDCNYSVLQIQKEGRDSTLDIMTWVPRIEEIIETIFNDFYKLVENRSSTSNKPTVDKPTVEIKIIIDKNIIKIIHMNSYASKTIDAFLDKLQNGGGALAKIANLCLNLMDYSVEAVWSTDESSETSKGESWRIPILSESEREGVPVISTNVEGFTHILHLYHDLDYTKNDNQKILKMRRKK